ncbi:coq5 methyltransferase : Putative methylase involved in ubiquinone menaquinone biosynthesis protein OS=Eutypa lata (strain UCR-EL1) GN=UCREL1_5373 PE=4 SV=1: Methyltransf_11 [Gemmata massiliana]|uniref:Methyltransferase type 11 domain-containing protein n=1 Tax=Gemmata massiliana TaxID=1210884 RepID=A0A6P2DHJ6_9BACT|nr:class I SAM-dependent methyltransferase [Gemmata massiliana]VTS00686.1 coq5 methyltransferase : Putative methylase involved in ubiquinone menaquinone biosynthesis protein OS=Eutypa lata (strain UCR-EL1) GN=UCREL1_5373 PE=4 SV=1: Methyltransf_11 [Gemmata massiliana]
MTGAPPQYDAYQSSFHEAFRVELYGVLDALPIPRGGSVLDVPCGDGFYSRRLAERLPAGATLAAVDASQEYLDRVRATVRADAVDVRRADAYELPFGAATFDLVWCAQSLISLDPARAVREMFRVTKPDGAVAILEVDEFHHVLLPWPAELEAVLPAAVHAACLREYGDGIKLAPTRKLRGLLDRVGFGSVRRTTISFDRAAPFGVRTAAFLTHHFEHLRRLARPRLLPALQKVFDRATDPGAADSLYNRPGSELVCINAIYLARPSRETSARLLSDGPPA